MASVNCNLRTEYCNNIVGVCGQYVLMQTLFMNCIEDFMKKIFRQIHLWLSVPFGLIITLICFSGAMLVFENEVMELARHELYYVKKVETVPLPVDRLLEEVELTLPDSVFVIGISVFSDPERAWQVNLSKPRRASIPLIRPRAGPRPPFPKGEGI